MSKKYVLLKDTPEHRAGDTLTWVENAACYAVKESYPIRLGDGSMATRTNGYDKETVENNPEWFEEIKESEKPFVWTDERVADFAMYWRDGVTLLGKEYVPQAIELFKSRQPKQSAPVDTVVKETILPSSAGLHVPDYLPNNPKVVGPDYKPKEDDTVVKDWESPKTKDELISLLTACVSETWGNPSLDKTQELYDNFLVKRKLVEPSLKQVNTFVTNKVNEILLGKKYTQQELDKAIEDAWSASRFPKTGFFRQDIFHYETIQEYKNFLKTLKK